MEWRRTRRRRSEEDEEEEDEEEEEEDEEKEEEGKERGRDEAGSATSIRRAAQPQRGMRNVQAHGP